jgi:hypothetical protein
MKTPLNVIFSYVLMLLATTASAMSAERVDFESQVKPIFDKYCLECHGEENEEAFRIDVDSDMLLYVNEGHPETSDLYTYMTLDEDDDNIMPPVGHEPRPAEPEIQLVSAWIAQGAQMDGASSASAEDANLAASDAGDTAIADAGRWHAHGIGAHLPIGLLLAAGLFALLSLGGSFVMSDCAYYCLWLGMWGAIFATASGWYYSPMEHRGAVSSVADLLDQTQPVFWHRLGAIITTVVAFVLCLFAKGARVLAAAIGWVGHTGGELTYGKDHYKDLNELVETFLSPAQSGTAPKADGAETNDMTDADADEIKIDIQDSNVEEGTFSAPTDI